MFRYSNTVRQAGGRERGANATVIFVPSSIECLSVVYEAMYAGIPLIITIA